MPKDAHTVTDKDDKQDAARTETTYPLSVEGQCVRLQDWYVTARNIKQMQAKRTPFTIYLLLEENHANVWVRILYRSLTTVDADKPDARLRTREAYPRVHTNDVSRSGRKNQVAGRGERIFPVEWPHPIRRRFPILICHMDYTHNTIFKSVIH
jgi:hypothetical protein